MSREILIAHISDSHFSARSERLEETIRLHHQFVRECRDIGVDLIVHGGDFFDAKSNPQERDALADFLTTAADVAPVVGVRGNHDAIGDLGLFNRLRTKHPIQILERPTAQPGSGRLVRLERGDTIGFLALPWFDKAGLAALMPADAGADQLREVTIGAARGLLDGLRAEASNLRRQGTVPILAAHVQIAGSVTSTGQILIGQSVELSASDLLEVGAEFTALGHIHARQGWLKGQVGYSGSPQRQNFGETEEKGWTLVGLVEGQFQFTEFHRLPARRIVLVETDLTSDERVALLAHPLSRLKDQFGGFSPSEIPDALVRIRYKIRPEHLSLVDDTALALIFSDLGAFKVQVEPVVVTQTRARCAEIVDKATTWEKVLAFWEAKQITPAPDQVERVRTRLTALESSEEGGVHAAA